MQRSLLLQLGTDIRMTEYAAVRHVCSLPERRVAGGAIITEAGMGAYAAQLCTGLCIQLTRAE